MQPTGLITIPGNILDAHRAELIRQTPRGGFLVRLLDPAGTVWKVGDDIHVGSGEFIQTAPRLPDGWGYDPITRFPADCRVEVLDAGDELAARGLHTLIGAQGEVFMHHTVPASIREGLPPVMITVRFEGQPIRVAQFWPEEIEIISAQAEAA